MSTKLSAIKRDPRTYTVLDYNGKHVKSLVERSFAVDSNGEIWSALRDDYLINGKDFESVEYNGHTFIRCRDYAKLFSEEDRHTEIDLIAGKMFTLEDAALYFETLCAKDCVTLLSKTKTSWSDEWILLPGGSKVRKHKVSSEIEETELNRLLSLERDAYKNKEIYIFLLDDLIDVGGVSIETNHIGHDLLKISFSPDLDASSATRILEDYWGEYAREMEVLPIFMLHMTNCDIVNYSGFVSFKDNSGHTYSVRMPPGSLHICGNMVPEDKSFHSEVIFCRS